MTELLTKRHRRQAAWWASAVLDRLDDQVSPDGAVATFGDNSFWVATSKWKAANDADSFEEDNEFLIRIGHRG